MRRTVTVAALLLAAGCALEPLPLPSSRGTSTSPPGTPCAEKSECDDGDPCTRDRCVEGQCSSTLDPGASCSDGDACNGYELCDAEGQCASGTPASVDDGSACTADSCDPATGVVSHTALPVDDGDACTTDTCNPATGAVSHTKVPGCGSPWTPTSTAGAPSARRDHTAVWTGSTMIVWGGEVKGSPLLTASGAVYDPASDSWTPTSMTGAPAPRRAHVAVWTGSKMIVWGGAGLGGYESSGGVYDPATDSWSSMSIAGAPTGRTDMTVVWTGSEMIVWGGIIAGVAQGSGGRYDPATDAWTAVPNGGAPIGRTEHSAVWTGSEMVIWGGSDIVDWHADGSRFSPAQNLWVGPTSLAGAPEWRRQHSGVWSGTHMVIWGGSNPFEYVASGGALDLSGGGSGTWTALSETGAPERRVQHSALWVGTKMLIWGGCGGSSCNTLFNDGGLWTPGPNGGTWATVEAEPSVLPRRLQTSIWTGEKVIVWGGVVKGGLTDTGAIFAP